MPEVAVHRSRENRSWIRPGKAVLGDADSPQNPERLLGDGRRARVAGVAEMPGGNGHAAFPEQSAAGAGGLRLTPPASDTRRSAAAKTACCPRGRESRRGRA